MGTFADRKKGFIIITISRMINDTPRGMNPASLIGAMSLRNRLKPLRL